MKPENIAKLEELSDAFAEHLRINNYSRETIIRHSYCVRDFYEFLVKKTDIEDITRIDKQTVLEYQKHLFYRPSKRNPQGKLDPWTQAKMLSTLNIFFKFLVRSNRLLFNPAQGVELPKQQKKLPRAVMTKREIKKLLIQPDTSTLLGYRDRTMLELLYSTGIRVNELRNLTIYDISLSEGLLKIVQGKGRKDRVVPLGSIACEYAKEYAEKIRPQWANNKSGDYLFLNRRGGQFSKTGINYMVKTYAKQANLSKPITTHSIRHTCATLMLESNADIRYIQELLGHRSIESTQIYTKVLIGSLKKVHQKTHPREKDAKEMKHIKLFKYKNK